MTPEELERMRREREQMKVAQSQATATPIQPQGPLQGGGIQQRQPGMAQQIGSKLLKTALGSALGPAGGFLGGLFNQGGKVDYAEEARKRIAKQNAAIKAGAQGQSNAPLQRALFVPDKSSPTGLKATGTQVPGDVIKGYANRPKQGQTQGTVDPYEGIAAQIKSAKAAGQPVDYNSLAALQHARQSGNKQKEMEAMRNFLAKNPGFKMPGGSQGVVLRNTGGPISKNPHGYNEGGATMEMPIKKKMDMDKMEAAKAMDALKGQQAERSFQMAEARKDKLMEQQMRQKEEAHQQAMKLKKESATMKAPLAKKE